ncbi:MAG: ABC transporter permease [Acidobacteria bacterium]|nr:ABC transporter permease [Acidobacteriota bacterium]
MFTLKMAQREFRASWKRFVFAIVAVALGVGAVTGVQGLSQALQRSLLREARQLIAADLRLRIGRLPTTGELAALAELRSREAEVTEAIETISMVGVTREMGRLQEMRIEKRRDTEAGEQDENSTSSRHALPALPGETASGLAAPVLVSLKAVEAGYPFYGKVELQPQGALHRMLEDGVAVSPDLLMRLNLKVGDHLRIGTAELPIVAVLLKEPDRLASGLEFGPRVLLSQKFLRLTGLIQFGSRATHNYLVRLPPSGLGLDEARRIVRSHSDRVRMADYRDPNPSLSRGLERMETFLNLTGLLTLLVGGLGVAVSMRAYLQQKLDNIAIIKSLGGRSGQILQIYLMQTLMVAFIGSLLGLAIGAVVQLSLPVLLRGILELQTQVEWSAEVGLQGLGIGLLSTTVLVFPALLAIRDVKAAEVFRRSMRDELVEWRRKVKRWGRWGRVFVTNVAVIGGVAAWLANSWRRGFGFVGTVTVLLLFLITVGHWVFGLLRKLPFLRPVCLRHGLSNLHRPGSQAPVSFAVLALGVTLILTVYLLQVSLLRQLIHNAPPDFPNLVLIGISEGQRPDVWNYLNSTAGVLTAGEAVAVVPARLISIDGEDIANRNLDEDERRFSRTEFSLTWARDLPPHTILLQGTWWQGRPASPEISIGQFAARTLQLRLGSKLIFRSVEKEVMGIVTSVRETESVQPGANNQFIFSPRALDALPANYVANVRARVDELPVLQQALFEKFPTITSVNISQVLVVVQRLVDRISVVIEFVAALAIAAGIMVLASSVASSRSQRVKEAVLLKVLGATRRKVVAIQAIEFAAIGLLAGLMGSAFANGLAYLLLDHLFHTEYRFLWMPLAVTIFATALLVITTGWLASASILKQKPLAALREL